jgi:dTDP-4-dehydrorhamnose reductase
LVTGSKGQLGSEISLIAPDYNFLSFIFIDKEEVDISDEKKLNDYLGQLKIDYVINCAAYTAVDLAEKEQEIAQKVNESSPLFLAKFCKQNKIRLIHISTDYVFDGESNRPINETSPTNPLSVYRGTKLAGEKCIQETLSNAYIIRTAWVYSVYGKNFVKTMLNLGKQKDQLSVIVDQMGTPTCARDLANTILLVIKNIEEGNDVPGIYHYTNEGVTSWYDFAVAIFELASIDCKVNAIPSSAYPTPAKRLTFSVLDKSKIKQTFKLDIPHWRVSLSKTLKELTT